MFVGLFGMVFEPLYLGPAGIALGLLCLVLKDIGFGVLAIIIGLIPTVISLVSKYS